jgi:hypothetical protein
LVARPATRFALMRVDHPPYCPRVNAAKAFSCVNGK